MQEKTTVSAVKRKVASLNEAEKCFGNGRICIKEV